MRNSNWAKKRKLLLKHSSLPFTSAYLDIENWNEAEIDKRAAAFATTAIEIWSLPA